LKEKEAGGAGGAVEEVIETWDDDFDFSVKTTTVTTDNTHRHRHRHSVANKKKNSGTKILTIIENKVPTHTTTSFHYLFSLPLFTTSFNYLFSLAFFTTSFLQHTKLISYLFFFIFSGVKMTTK
jgi:hypothetical protein